MQINPSDLISMAEAARLIGMTHQGISYLLERRILQTIPIAGKKLVLRQEAVNYRLMREEKKNGPQRNTQRN